MQQKQTKQRTCVVCRATHGKGDLLRIVRTPEGRVCFDATGRANGRGAYVCGLSCFEKAAKTKALERSLRVRLTNEDYERISQQMVQALFGKDE